MTDEHRKNISKAKTKAIEYLRNENGCHICTSHKPNNKGYPCIRRNKKHYLLHRFIYVEHFGEIPEGFLICHKCDNRACINPDHFFLGTSLDNTTDMINKGRNRILKGEECGRHKLTEIDVINIRNDTRPQTHIAKDYGMDSSSICDIKNRVSWKHI